MDRPNQEWSMDFLMDGLATGRAIRVLTVVDSYTRKCLAISNGPFTFVIGRINDFSPFFYAFLTVATPH
jgi:hypothetical protein